MKKSLTCPKCEGRKIAHVRSLPYLDQGAQYGWIRELPLAIRRTYRGIVHTIGGLELFVCRNCSFVEMYALDLHKLDPRVDENVRFIDNEPKATLR